MDVGYRWSDTVGLRSFQRLDGTVCLLLVHTIHHRGSLYVQMLYTHMIVLLLVHSIHHRGSLYVQMLYTHMIVLLSKGSPRERSTCNGI